LSKEGFDVTGSDFSIEAVIYAQSMIGPDAKFIVADMAEKLPFSDSCFDAVMSNVAAHMFSDSITRSIFSEVKRILRPLGLFLFHVGALEDRSLRPRYKQGREIEPNYVVAEDGGTKHFFSKEYLLELLSDWQDVHLEPVEILYNESQEQFKHLVVNNDQGKRQRISLLERGFVLRRFLWRGIIRH
jgi:SAM-dependent methyltransferase